MHLSDIGDMNGVHVIHRAFRTILLAVLLSACGVDSDGVKGRAEARSGPGRPECIAPSKPGGGFDLTCKLAQAGLLEVGILSRPMRITYQPGGIGAVTLNSVVIQRPADRNLIVAFSGGSLLNLAQGKFGRYTEDDVRWIAAVGIDYGMIAVRADSKHRTLSELIKSLKQDATSIVFGAGGTVGSQDWMKSAMVARAAGINYRLMRYVSFEGGGEAQVALLGGHIDAYSGDISEVQGLLEGGRLRVLAVMSEDRLPEPFDEVMTAREQGFEITWPILRGYYTGPAVNDRDYAWWVQGFDKLMADPRFDELRSELGMFPYAKTGAALSVVIKERMKHYRALVDEFNLQPHGE